MTLSQYIHSLETLDQSGAKDAKIRDLLDYYQKYNQSVKPGPGVTYGAIYARYSSHSQRDESIEGQVREDLEWAARHNVIVTHVYIDRKLTGKEAENRADFQRLMQDSARGKWQYAICWKVDRFARNRYDSAIYKARLKKYNVRVVYARESIPDGPEGILLESVLEGQAEYYSASLSENIRRGQKDNALECKSNGGIIPTGYRVGPSGKFEIDPPGAAVVRLIFEMYDSGKTYKEIEDSLNAQGLKTVKGKPFGKNSFGRILRNRKYVGVYTYNGHEVEGGIPAIIEKEAFDRVQKKLDTSKKARARKRGEEEYLLTPKIYCGLCGKGMIGDSGRSRGGEIYRYYTCAGRKRDHLCKKNPVPKDWIENLIIDETIRMLLDDKIITEIADAVMEYQAREDDLTLLHTMQVQLSDTVTKIENLLDAIEQGIITPSTKDRLEALEDEKARLQNGIAEESIVQPTVSRKQVIFFLEQMRCGDAKDPEYRRKLVDVFVNSIFVYDDKIVVTYNYTGENNTLTLDMVNTALEGFEGVENCSDKACDAPPFQMSKTKTRFFI